MSAARRRRVRPRGGFWDALMTFRETSDLTRNGIHDDFLWGLRDRSPGREVAW